jgi:hypothetical protein
MKSIKWNRIEVTDVKTIYFEKYQRNTALFDVFNRRRWSIDFHSMQQRIVV